MRGITTDLELYQSRLSDTINLKEGSQPILFEAITCVVPRLQKA
jgi:hypothetical protein